jgi:multidrug efflux pump subunit AcrB
VLVIIFKQAGANVIDTVDRIKAQLPQTGTVDPAVRDVVAILSDRTTTIRASVNDVQVSPCSQRAGGHGDLSFLRRFWPTFIACVTVPLALAGTLALCTCCITAWIICP